MEKFMKASDKAAKFLGGQLGLDGRLKDRRCGTDLLPIYKLPTLLILSGQMDKAHQLLTRIKEDYMQSDGDLLSYPEKTGRDRKSSSFPMCHFWTYMNSWVAMAAHRLGRFDVSVPLYKFCQTFYNPEHQGMCVSEPYSQITEESTMDVMAIAHFGLLALYMGDVYKARKLGESLLKIMEAQPNPDTEYLCRLSAKTGSLITSPQQGLEPFYVIKKTRPNQLYFILGYHGIFLTKLYQATSDSSFLDGAKDVIEFAMTCHEGICQTTLSHKVMYAAALVAMETKEAKYRRFAIGLGEYMLMTQTEDGLFCKDAELMDRYDQSAEIAIWLRETCAALEHLKV